MLKRLLLSGAALAALTVYAAAQATPPADQSSPPAASSPASPGMTAPSEQAEAKTDPNLFSNIKGASVVGANNESIGSVADLLLAPDGSLKSIVIGHGGLVGIGQTYRNYEVSELPQVADGKLTLGQIDTAALEGMPEYDYPEAETGRAATDSAPAGGAPPADSAAKAPLAGGNLWPASYIVGAKVGEGENAGSVSDLRFEGNKVSKVLIDQGSLGLGNKLQEVAFEDIEISGTPAEPKLALKSGAGAAGSSMSPDASSPSAPASPAPANP